jgi:hypothetical protein
MQHRPYTIGNAAYWYLRGVADILLFEYKDEFWPTNKACTL